MKFVIIHGAYGTPNENWFPWLKDKLLEEGHEVILPAFPTPKNQTLDNWMEVFKPYFSQIDEETIFVGHSLAPAFILSVLERIDVKVKACFFVAGFTNLLGNPTFDEINKTFVDKEFDWEKINSHSEQFYVFNSDNDPYVPIVKGKNLANKLGTEVIEFEGAGHFNKDAGYLKFDILLDYIKLALRQNKVSCTNSKNEKLVGIASNSNNNMKVAILAHGFGVTKTKGGMFEQITMKLNENDFKVYRFDFSGCGESEGDYKNTSLTKLKSDLKSIIDFVSQTEGVSSKEIYLLGQSFGTATTLALKPDVKRIILMGSIAHPKKIMSEIFEDAYNPSGVSKRVSSSGITTEINSKFWSICDDYDLIKNVSQITSPILFIHGTADDKVPLSEGQELFNNANEPKELCVIENADHGYSKHRFEMLKAIISWFKN